MTREEAIKILDLETRLEYLAEVEYRAGFRGVGSVSNAMKDALNMAISALREQEENDIQRHLKHFDIKEPRPETVIKCNDLFDEDGGEILNRIESDTVKNGWISVEERLPKEFVSVLVYMPEERPLPTVHEGFLAREGVWYANHFDRDPMEITHWMPLPEPPKEEV